MSGGSFNYLYAKGLGEILDSQELDHMLEELEGLGYDAEKAAAATRKIAAARAELSKEIGAIASVWHALEWWRSGDWSEQQFWKAVGKWEAA